MLRWFHDGQRYARKPYVRIPALYETEGRHGGVYRILRFILEYRYGRSIHIYYPYRKYVQGYLQEKGYESRLLSRTTEDSVTVTSVLVPWNTCGMTQATILGVATLTYLPYCFFNLISPLMSITMAAIGFKIKQHHEEDQSIIVN